MKDINDGTWVVKTSGGECEEVDGLFTMRGSALVFLNADDGEVLHAFGPLAWREVFR